MPSASTELAPETDRERALLADPVIQEGLAWGKPRRGHPEGTVGAHVASLLETIDSWGETGTRREELRFLALVHDSLKNRVKNWLPRTGENHHAMRARRFAEGYTDDERLLATIEQHDRPYSIWRKVRAKGRQDDHALDAMIDRIPDLDLFLRFVELDGSTDGKAHEPERGLSGDQHHGDEEGHPDPQCDGERALGSDAVDHEPVHITAEDGRNRQNHEERDLCSLLKSNGADGVQGHERHDGTDGVLINE